MFEDHSDITKRIGETPKWCDENGVPRYVRDYDDRISWEIKLFGGDRMAGEA